MGERNYKSKLDEGTFTLWARDALKVIENGTSGHNTYSYHPVYLRKELSNYFHITFLRTSNAMDFTVHK